MVKARKYVVKRAFSGIPKRDDFDVVEQDLPALKDGEVLLKAEWISVDPYMRAYNGRYPTPYDQFGFQVATVQESKHPDYPVGTKAVTHEGWRTYTIVNPNIKKPDGFSMTYKLPELSGLSPSLGVGVLGMPGATAYFGFLDICKPKPGETVVVTGAAGAVGSIVGQIAKIKGCKVIGFAGSEKKVQWLEKELGFDKAFNYKTVDVAKALKEAAPNGVDCYFDNVGGEISSTILMAMNTFGRISICGAISSYNGTSLPKATIVQSPMVMKQLKMEGFMFSQFWDRLPEALADLSKWLLSGQIKAKEHVTEGFDQIYDAFIGMLAGENSGKAVIKV